MKRMIAALAVLVVITGCTMWQKAPADDPATPNDETADHNAQVKKEEDQFKAGGEVVKALVPPPFSWIVSLAVQGVLSAAAMRRQ